MFLLDFPSCCHTLEGFIELTNIIDHFIADIVHNLFLGIFLLGITLTNWIISSCAKQSVAYRLPSADVIFS